MPNYQRYKSPQELQIYDFAPDLAFDMSQQQGGVILVDMDQAQPTVKGYQTLNSAQPYVATPLPELPLGATLDYFSTRETQVFAGGAMHLWRAFGNTWVQADLLGAGSFGAAARWRFAQFNDDVLAFNASVGPPQVATGALGIFAPLGGAPPQHVTTGLAVNGQVLAFSGTNWYASALGNDNNWTPDIQTQAGAGTLYDFPGDIVACAPIYRNVVVFKQGAAWIGSYVGGEAVWSFQLISDLTGTWCQESVIVLPDCVAFVGIDDFYTTSGYAPQRIPNNVKEWFFDQADPNNFQNMLSRYDPNHAVAYWYFVSKAPAVANTPDRYVGYNTRTGRWAAGYLVTPYVPAPNFQGGVLTGLYFDQSNVLQTWTGMPGVSTYTTGFFGTPGVFSQIMRAKPVYYVAPQYATVQPYHVTNLGGPVVTGPSSVLGSDGWYYFRQYDRWHQFKINMVGPGVIEPNVQTGAEISARDLDYRAGGLR